MNDLDRLRMHFEYMHELERGYVILKRILLHADYVSLHKQELAIDGFVDVDEDEAKWLILFMTIRAES
jgi:hypothetical protein